MNDRPLAPHEKALWRRVARTLRARKRGKAAASTLVENPVPAPAGARKPARRPAPGPAVAAKRPDDVFSAGDPGVERKARRRRLPVERAVDLHGLTQRAAHAALVSFLTKARVDGCRCVLVITGKGVDVKIDPFTERAPRGVIRARFRSWVNEPPLREMISRVSPAHQRDGGSGAFYVFLKRRVSDAVS